MALLALIVTQVHREFQQRVGDRAESDAFIAALTTDSAAELRKCEMEIAAILTLLHEADEAGVEPIVKMPGGRGKVIVLLLRCLDVIRLRVLDIHRRLHEADLAAIHEKSLKKHSGRRLTEAVYKVHHVSADDVDMRVTRVFSAIRLRSFLKPLTLCFWCL